MPKLPSFKVRKTPKGWLLNIPASISDTEKLQRRYFKTRELALDAAQKLRGDFKSHGVGASVLPPRVAGDAYSAWLILEPLGISLTAAAKIVAEIERRKAESEMIEPAFVAFLTTKDTAVEKQQNTYRLAGAALHKEFPERVLASITGPELLAHIKKVTSGPGSFNQRVRIIKAAWRWFAKQPRQWCDVGILEQLERQETISKPIGVLSAIECETLMRAAEKNYPDIIPAFAIALFTGMRKQEIERLDASDVTSEGITVPAINAKTRRRRFIQMPEPLAAWLNVYPVQETVMPVDWIRKEKAVRRLAGWKVWSALVEPHAAPEDLPRWPENALRHTAATVALAIGKPIEKLVFEHGHSGGLVTLQRHYIGVMPKAEAEKIWALRPTV